MVERRKTNSQKDPSSISDLNLRFHRLCQSLNNAEEAMNPSSPRKMDNSLTPKTVQIQVAIHPNMSDFCAPYVPDENLLTKHLIMEIIEVPTDSTVGFLKSEICRRIDFPLDPKFLKLIRFSKSRFLSQDPSGSIDDEANADKKKESGWGEKGEEDKGEKSLNNNFVTDNESQDEAVIREDDLSLAACGLTSIRGVYIDIDTDAVIAQMSRDTVPFPKEGVYHGSALEDKSRHHSDIAMHDVSNNSIGDGINKEIDSSNKDTKSADEFILTTNDLKSKNDDTTNNNSNNNNSNNNSSSSDVNDNATSSRNRLREDLLASDDHTSESNSKATSNEVAKQAPAAETSVSPPLPPLAEAGQGTSPPCIDSGGANENEIYRGVKKRAREVEAAEEGRESLGVAAAEASKASKVTESAETVEVVDKGEIQVEGRRVRIESREGGQRTAKDNESSRLETPREIQGQKASKTTAAAASFTPLSLVPSSSSSTLNPTPKSSVAATPPPSSSASPPSNSLHMLTAAAPSPSTRITRSSSSSAAAAAAGAVIATTTTTGTTSTTTTTTTTTTGTTTETSNDNYSTEREAPRRIAATPIPLIRTRTRWTLKETEVLVALIEEHGQKWSKIATGYAMIFHGRGQGQLKDKWRNLQKALGGGFCGMRGEIIPHDLQLKIKRLDDILTARGSIYNGEV